MTLVEAVVALVILALVGVGCLELAQGASRLEYNATQWNAAVTMAESRMAEFALGSPAAVPDDRPATDVEARRARATRVMRAPWRPGLDVISVTVPVADGKSYVLQRLVPAANRRPVVPVP